MKEFNFEINHDGEIDAGIRPFWEDVKIIVKNHPGGEEEGEYSFQDFILQALREWFDGASVYLKEANDE